jgi:subtilisin family serine protease
VLCSGYGAVPASALPQQAAAGGQVQAADRGASDTEGLVLVTEDASEYTDDQVVVCYRDGSVEVVTYEDDDALTQGLTQLVQDETVALVQPNYDYESTGLSTTDTYAGKQWALANDGSFYVSQGTRSSRQTAVSGIDIGVQQAWAAYDGGSRDVVIALIDTGVDSSHEDLQNVLWTNTGEIPGNGIDDDHNGYIDDVNGWNFYNNNNKIYVSSTDDSHGTHAAGTIAATADNGVGIAGIVQSDHVKIMVLKALGGSDGTGTTASIIQAIQYAQANGASICNLSLGSSSLDRALYQTMANSSMLFVVAAGNDGVNADRTPCYPACFSLDNIISVANLSYTGTLHETSNYGASSVDLAAPGTYILSTTPNNRYSYMTGTSMAAPMVTAAAAMVYSAYEDLTLTQVKQALLSSVRTLDSLSGKTLTGGMLDLSAALSYAAGVTTGGTTQTSADTTSASTPTTAQGSAPVITFSTRTAGGKTFLTVTVTDADGDLKQTAYASGQVTAEHFQGGLAGQRFSPGRDGTTTFTVSRSGVYTFYAVDSAGNETVSSVHVTSGMPARYR